MLFITYIYIYICMCIYIYIYIYIGICSLYVRYIYVYIVNLRRDRAQATQVRGPLRAVGRAPDALQGSG